MIKYQRLIGYSLLLLFVSGITYSVGTATHFYPQTTVAAVQPAKPDIYELWQLTNQERATAGVAPLVLDPKLDESAAAKCSDMASKNYWSHDAPDGKTPEDFIKPVVSYHYSIWGENLAFGFNSSQQTISAWMASKPHREALLNTQFTNVGFAICSDTANPNMVVQHFVAL